MSPTRGLHGSRRARCGTSHRSRHPGGFLRIVKRVGGTLELVADELEHVQRSPRSSGRAGSPDRPGGSSGYGRDLEDTRLLRMIDARVREPDRAIESISRRPELSDNAPDIALAMSDSRVVSRDRHRCRGRSASAVTDRYRLGSLREVFLFREPHRHRLAVATIPRPPRTRVLQRLGWRVRVALRWGWTEWINDIRSSSVPA